MNMKRSRSLLSVFKDVRRLTSHPCSVGDRHGVDKCGLVTEESRSVLNVLLLGDLQLKP